MLSYPESEWFTLSGISHFSTCRRRWALIMLEHVWADNYHTLKGSVLHGRAHDTNLVESRGDVVTEHGQQVHSRRLGLVGECDVVEFRRSDDGVRLHGREGTWRPYPVEYKKGDGTYAVQDSLQLCAQAMCLEEMLCCDVPFGFLFYFEVRRRTRIDFTAELRTCVERVVSEMHDLYDRHRIPVVKRSRICASCSLKDLCGLDAANGVSDVDGYIRKYLEEVGS